MRRLMLSAALLFSFALAAFAQGTTGTGAQSGTAGSETTKEKKEKKGAAAGAESSSMSSSAAKEHQLTGCLAKDSSGQGFTLTNGRYKQGVAVKSSQDLSAHVGHEVRVNGTWDKAPAAGSKEPPTFTATKLQHLSETCTAGMAKATDKSTKGAKTK